MFSDPLILPSPPVSYLSGMVARFIFAFVAAVGILGVAVFLGAGAAVVWVGLLSFVVFMLAFAPKEPKCNLCGRVVSHLHSGRWRCDRCDREQEGPNFDYL
jgi:hypothetical protein